MRPQHLEKGGPLNGDQGLVLLLRAQAHEVAKLCDSVPVNLLWSSLPLISVFGSRFNIGPVRVPIFVVPVGTSELPVYVNDNSGFFCTRAVLIAREDALRCRRDDRSFFGGKESQGNFNVLFPGF